ncbi:hypothetical protein GGP50_002653 [Salinibacter ruber]|uniref:sulfotransferase domain-containing protein n=1 Tax=Salinibacter ruber TaxID=146919 RepID=UPI00216AA665|nr:sulfotransferase domain-containing protein [Salinibacter ruber]MCS4194427.1 hypothetical protein [Salinibacter ruber]
MGNYFLYASRLIGWERPWHDDFANIHFYLTERKNLGWKHRLVDVEGIDRSRAHEILFVTVTKNPYAWLLSTYRRPYGIGEPSNRDHLEAFITQRCEGIRYKEGGLGAFESPLDMWNRKNRAYLDLADSFDVFNVKYENVLLNTRDVIEEVADTYGLSMKGESFANVQASTKDDGKDLAFYRQYYGERKWRQEFTPEAVEFINENVDKGVMQAFGYEVVGPSEVGES